MENVETLHSWTSETREWQKCSNQPPPPNQKNGTIFILFINNNLPRITRETLDNVSNVSRINIII
jgi:hypothetical protein